MIPLIELPAARLRPPQAGAEVPPTPDDGFLRAVDDPPLRPGDADRPAAEPARTTRPRAPSHDGAEDAPPPAASTPLAEPPAALALPSASGAASVSNAAPASDAPLAPADAASGYDRPGQPGALAVGPLPMPPPVPPPVPVASVVASARDLPLGADAPGQAGPIADGPLGAPPMQMASVAPSAPDLPGQTEIAAPPAPQAGHPPEAARRGRGNPPHQPALAAAAGFGLAAQQFLVAQSLPEPGLAARPGGRVPGDAVGMSGGAAAGPGAAQPVAAQPPLAPGEAEPPIESNKNQYVETGPLARATNPTAAASGDPAPQSSGIAAPQPAPPFRASLRSEYFQAEAILIWKSGVSGSVEAPAAAPNAPGPAPDPAPAQGVVRGAVSVPPAQPVAGPTPASAPAQASMPSEARAAIEAPANVESPGVARPATAGFPAVENPAEAAAPLAQPTPAGSAAWAAAVPVSPAIAPGTPTPPALPAPFHPLVESIRSHAARHVKAAAPGTISGTELVLHPAELGRIRFALSGTGDQLTVTVVAENRDTLALLQRHGTDLRAELAQEGLGRASLTFGSWDQGSARNPSQQRETPTTPWIAEAAAPAAGIVPPPQPRPRPPIPGQGIDLRF